MKDDESYTVSKMKYVCFDGAKQPSFLFSGGMSSHDATEMMRDFSTKLIISDLGNGSYRHQLIRKRFPTDVTFRMNEEFSYPHPVVHETIRVR
jgi:hypothetical protein